MIGLSAKSLKPPKVVRDMMRAQWGTAIVMNCTSLKLFDAVDLGFRSPDEVARECSIQPRAAELLLNALVSLELLTKDEKGFNTTEESHYYLVSTSPLYIGGIFQAGSSTRDAWMNLETVVREGKPHSEINKQSTAEDFFPALAAALFPMNYAYGQRLAEFFNVEGKTEKIRVLDLACGSGVWSIPLARASKNVSVDGLDFPSVLEVAKQFTEKSAVKDQYNYLKGNWQDIALADDEYDIAILGHILHSEGKERSRELLSYVQKSLKQGGSIAIAEFLVDETRTAPSFSAMFAVNMYLVTTDGCVFSNDELREMLKEAGFSNVRELPRDQMDADVIIADKV